LGTTERTAIQSEMRQLMTAIDGIGGRTKFSGNSLLNNNTDGSASAADITLQVSNNTTDIITLSKSAFNKIGVGTAASGDINTDANSFTLGGGSALMVKINVVAVRGSGSTAATAMQEVQAAASDYIKTLSTQRSLLGAYQNQIEFTVSNTTELASNLSAARSNVQDTDYASETASLTKGQILQQAATAMLAQANQMPNVILSLLK